MSPSEPVKRNPTNRDKMHPMVARTLQGPLAIMQRPSITAKYATDPGSADILCAVNGFSACIEVKTGNGNIPFAGWRDNQRGWAEQWCRALNTEYWIWWGVRNLPPDKTTGYLIPYTEQLFLENMIRPVQASLPYKVEAGMSKILQEKRWDCTNLLGDFETPIYSEVLGLDKNGKRRHAYYFDLPETHPFRLHYMTPESTGGLWEAEWIAQSKGAKEDAEISQEG